MKYRNSIPLIATAAIAALAARGRPADAVGTESQETTAGPQGSVEGQS